MEQQQKIEVAKTLYLATDKTQGEIADIVGWTDKTFTEQKQKGKWKELREGKKMSKQQIISLLHLQALKMVEAARDEDRIMTSNEVDCIAKIAASIDKLEKRATIETFIDVFVQYNNWLITQNNSLAKTNNEYQDKFINYLLKQK